MYTGHARRETIGVCRLASVGYRVSTEVGAITSTTHTVFEQGEHIVYGTTGVCLVADIVPARTLGLSNSDSDPDELYYRLKPLFDTSTIYVPVEPESAVPMRRILTKEEAEQLIDLIPTLSVSANTESAASELSRQYKEKICTVDCKDLIELTMSIYSKKMGGKFGAIDKRYMKQAEKLLFGELSVALGVREEDVPSCIEERVNALQAGR